MEKHTNTRSLLGISTSQAALVWVLDRVFVEAFTLIYIGIISRAFQNHLLHQSHIKKKLRRKYIHKIWQITILPNICSIFRLHHDRNRIADGWEHDPTKLKFSNLQNKGVIGRILDVLTTSTNLCINSRNTYTIGYMAHFQKIKISLDPRRWPDILHNKTNISKNSNSSLSRPIQTILYADRCLRFSHRWPSLST